MFQNIFWLWSLHTFFQLYEVSHFSIKSIIIFVHYRTEPELYLLLILCIFRKVLGLKMCIIAVFISNFKLFFMTCSYIFMSHFDIWHKILFHFVRINFHWLVLNWFFARFVSALSWVVIMKNVIITQVQIAFGLDVNSWHQNTFIPLFFSIHHIQIWVCKINNFLFNWDFISIRPIHLNKSIKSQQQNKNSNQSAYNSSNFRALLSFVLFISLRVSDFLIKLKILFIKVSLLEKVVYNTI